MIAALPRPRSTRCRSRPFPLEYVSWEYYEHTLQEIVRNGLHTRVTYDQGRMELMTTSSAHEWVKKALARLLELYAMEMDIPLSGLGSVTCRLKKIRRGLEPDECYYISTPPPPITPKGLDLTKYPPPDLAIEVDISAGSIRKEPIYADLGIPEVWRVEGSRIIPLHRTPQGTYVVAERSRALPDLPLPVFNRFLEMAMDRSQHEAARGFRDWLRRHRRS